MTYSIVALSDDGASLGVATASASLALGGMVPALAPRVGALVTQAWTNVTFRPRGLELLRSGLAPADVVDVLAAEDEGIERRQVALVDARGRVASRTGSGCTPWAGGLEGDRVVVVGNCLAGPGVLDAMLAAYRDCGAWSSAEPQSRSVAEPHSRRRTAISTTTNRNLDDDEPQSRRRTEPHSRPGGAGDLGRRLVAALAAGEAAGGDVRGRQSAALVVAAVDEDDVAPPRTALDLRVDDHRDPVVELGRLLALATAEGEAAEVERSDG
ncbi:DUF1028 domain-containing protein [Georgenia sp. Z1344]|uniref:DUF1028 domain-containing protein n=1 Tax=Georgenia sp. Z1344 TaxID=3416706 RepID=UPI003CF7F0BD